MAAPQILWFRQDLRLADQAIATLARRNETQVLWLVGDSIQRTANNDFDIYFMEGAGGVLVGVFNAQIGRRDLAEAIMEAEK